ncbi:MAG TPA: lytic transglycosylase domain-containing protein [Sphingomicrobium sp.]|nr:lytic transglycosylase domain-containing protein [Sphingomicrobium sp.]
MIAEVLLSAGLAAAAQPASPDPLAPLPKAAQPVVPAPQQQGVQPIPTPAVVIPRDWRGVFAAIRAGNWAGAQAGIAALPPDELTPVALAELYTAKGSPTVDLPRLQWLIAQAPDLPDADQLARLAVTRGATSPPPIIPQRRVVGLGSAPARYRGKPVRGEPVADALRTQLDAFIQNNDAASAEAAFLAQAPYLSGDARGEAAQRVAWTYYTTGRDFDARRVADYWRTGASGEWRSQAAWVSGLASWRLSDCNSAARAFREVAASATQRELAAAGYYWAARSEQACRRPQAVQGLLQAAAASPESFYGLIARETLGTETRIPASPPVATASVEALPNVRRAVRLVAIGEISLAEEMLRHQAKIGSPADHPALLEIAKRMSLAGAQYWLATNGQSGVRVDMASRYPRPAWNPVRGWRVDPGLAYAHIIQESNFRSSAVSPVGAVGLMQVRPGSASDEAAAAGLPYSYSALFDPTYNLEFGQSFIERMRRSPNTGGQLPKVIASYNAGPVPVGRWASIPDKGDPLLWIESLPYWETRYYVPAVMRNMWVYQGLDRQEQVSLKALAQHRWPGFPSSR